MNHEQERGGLSPEDQRRHRLRERVREIVRGDETGSPRIEAYTLYAILQRAEHAGKYLYSPEYMKDSISDAESEELEKAKAKGATAEVGITMLLSGKSPTLARGALREVRAIYEAYESVAEEIVDNSSTLLPSLLTRTDNYRQNKIIEKASEIFIDDIQAINLEKDTQPPQHQG